MNHLLIGGTNDGSRMSIPDDQSTIRLRVKTQNLPEYRGDLQVDRQTFAIGAETYTRQLLRGETKTFEVFVIYGMTADGMIERLIEHYHSKSA